MLRITWLLIGVLGAGGCAGGPELNRPNVVLLTLDTVRADVMGSYGAKVQATPNFDALAQNGAIFERAYTVTPLTIPAHASILTGLYPPRHGVQDNGDFLLSEDANTLAERLRASGYQTVASVGAEVTSHHWGFAQPHKVSCLCMFCHHPHVQSYSKCRPPLIHYYPPCQRQHRL